MPKTTDSKTLSPAQEIRFLRIGLNSIVKDFYNDFNYLFFEENSALPFVQENINDFRNALRSRGVTRNNYRQFTDIMVATKFYYKWRALDHIFDNLPLLTGGYEDSSQISVENYESKVSELVSGHVSVTGVKGIIMDYLSINKSKQLNVFLNHDNNSKVKELVNLCINKQDKFGYEFIIQYCKYKSFEEVNECISRRNNSIAEGKKLPLPTITNKPNDPILTESVSNDSAVQNDQKLRPKRTASDARLDISTAEPSSKVTKVNEVERVEQKDQKDQTASAMQIA